MTSTRSTGSTARARTRRTSRCPATTARARRRGRSCTRACSRTSTSTCSRTTRTPDEDNWVNEGLSDWAQTLTGYVNPATPITETGFDSHTQCFLGWLGVQTPANPNPRNGGPENSLTRWGDQGDGEILCDYGAAYTFMSSSPTGTGRDFMSRAAPDDGERPGRRAGGARPSQELQGDASGHRPRLGA